MCDAAREAGAWGAKLTGGGGGGCMIALVATRDGARPVTEALSSLGYECFVTEIERTEIA
jgi:mevalonate kinase